jgi:hypothetical protein
VPSAARGSFGSAQITRVRSEMGVSGRRRGDEIAGTAGDALSRADLANAAFRGSL